MKSLLIVALLATGLWANVQGQNSTQPNAIGETANDAAVRNVLREMAAGRLADNDSHLIDLIKKGITEAATSRQDANDSKAFLRAGAKKAQLLVAEVTAAYTQAIFKSKDAIEARKNLSRFQATIQMIVDFTKEGKFAP